MLKIFGPRMHGAYWIGMVEGVAVELSSAEQKRKMD
jgi:hypothetical protein